MANHLRRVNNGLSWWGPQPIGEQIGRARACPIDVSFDQITVTFDTSCNIWSYDLGTEAFTFDSELIRMSSQEGSAAPATMDAN